MKSYRTPTPGRWVSSISSKSGTLRHFRPVPRPTEPWLRGRAIRSEGWLKTRAAADPPVALAARRHAPRARDPPLPHARSDGRRGRRGPAAAPRSGHWRCSSGRRGRWGPSSGCGTWRRSEGSVLWACRPPWSSTRGLQCAPCGCAVSSREELPREPRDVRSRAALSSFPARNHRSITFSIGVGRAGQAHPKGLSYPRRGRVRSGFAACADSLRTRVEPLQAAV